MTKFDEREAIRQEMEFIKEQSRRDAEFYWEMRAHRNARFTELQNRLREIDEREHEWETKPVEQVVAPEPRVGKVRFAELTKEQQIIDRYQEQPKKREIAVNTKRMQEALRVSEEIANFIKNKQKEVTPKEIGNHLAETMGKNYANIGEVLKRAQKNDPHIQKKIQGKRAFYSYQQ